MFRTELLKFSRQKIPTLFVPGKFNSADQVSKPHPSNEYINNKCWTTGPSFLQQENNDWIDKYKLEEVIQNSIPETEVNDYQTDFKQIPDATIFDRKILSSISGFF